MMNDARIRSKITEQSGPGRLEDFTSFSALPNKTYHFATNWLIHLHFDAVRHQGPFPSELTVNSWSVNEQKIKLHFALFGSL